MEFNSGFKGLSDHPCALEWDMVLPLWFTIWYIC